MKSLSELLKNLESKEHVDAAFLTGSHGTTSSSTDSDIDVVVILDSNKTNLRSVYEKIDGVFADIFFFDKQEIEGVLQKNKVSSDSFDGLLVNWLTKADIKFDKSGLTTRLKEKAPSFVYIISEAEQNSILEKISYNYFQNQRYFSAKDPLYQEALQMRLLYSVSQLFSGFLMFRNEPWRGEKQAIKFIKKNKPEFYELFVKYQSVINLEEKMTIYKEMVQRALPEGVKLFDFETPVALSRGSNPSQEMEMQKKFWEELVS